jgi:hypothetical protein
MTRTTRAELDELAAMIDDRLRLPDGTHRIGYAYGRPRLERNGGSVDVSPRLPTGDLATWLYAYLAGIAAGWEAAPTGARPALCHVHPGGTIHNHERYRMAEMAHPGAYHEHEYAPEWTP